MYNRSMIDISTTKDLTDEILVKKALEDVRFFGVLLQRYENKLKRYIMRISYFSLEETEEILQEVFIKVWKNLRGFDDTLKFSSWIYRITRNYTISAFRKHKSRGLDKSIQLEPEIFDNLPDELDIAKEMDTNLAAQKVHKILNMLPKVYRGVLVLRFLEEKTYTEIADIMQKPEGTIATLIHRAKKRFKKIAEQNGEELYD